MSFLNPLFLFGLAAAAIPILIHLFTRRRPREVHFPSLEFLSEVHQSEIRRLKLKQWLLLLLRTLAVAAIALAMARPALRGSAGGATRAATSVVALVDVSGSMQAAAPAVGTTAASTLGAAARQAVDDLISTLGPADELLLVPYDRTPRPVTAQPSSDVVRLHAAAHALEPGAAATDHAGALAFAGRVLAESHALNRELFWISDFQASGWPDTATRISPPGPWGRARVYLLPLAARTRANAALIDALLAPAESGAALALEGAAFDATAGDLAVTALEVAIPAASDGAATGTGSELGRGFLNLPARGRASALIPLARLPEGGGEARIPDDALPLDNARYFSSGRAATLRVLVREDRGPSPLRLALAAGSPASGLAVEAVDAVDLEKRARDADAIVLNDLERLGPAELQAVLDFWRAGGALMIVLGSHADAAFWNSAVLRELGVGALGADDAVPEGGTWRLRVAATGHPVLAGFAARPGEEISTARFSAARVFDSGRGRVLLQFDRAHAALVEAPHALVLCATLDPGTSDFPVSGAFLPLLHQAVKVLGRGSAMGSLAPGDRYRAPASTGAWRIVGMDGRELASELSSESGTLRLVSAPIDRPGLYRVFRGGELRSVFAVNPDPHESDLAAVEPRTLLRAFPAGHASLLTPGADLAKRVREARYGRELWREMVLLALALLTAEMILARIGMGPDVRAAKGLTPTSGPG